jgi:hypothetical protein
MDMGISQISVSIVAGCIFFLGEFVSAQQDHQYRGHISEVNTHDTHQSTKIDVFVKELRDATQKYHDIEAAFADGYILFGPDMPNMGEHYVNPSHAVTRGFNPLRPSVITYLPVDGKRILTGVAYTLPVQPGEQPPPLRFEDARWHYHSGNLEEEAYGLHEHSMHDDHADNVRLGMVHAWVWSVNPHGLFAADNWALSYMRTGLEAPNDPNPDASKALFMMHGGVEYYSRFVDLAIRPNEETLSEVQQIMSRYRIKVQRIADIMKSRSNVLPSEEQTLSILWNTMWEEIGEMISESDRNTLSGYLHQHHNH